MLDVYSPKPHEGGLLLDGMERILVIESGFILGMSARITNIGIVHAGLDQTLGIPLSLAVAEKKSWTLAKK